IRDRNVTGVQTCALPIFEPSDLIPGNSFVKSPSLKNTGVVNCYVRMLVECSTSEMEQALEIDWNTTDWTSKQEDGYYYYKKSLSPGETSVPKIGRAHV